MTLEERLYTALREAQAEISSLHEEHRPLLNHVQHRAYWDREALIAEYDKHRTITPWTRWKALCWLFDHNWRLQPDHTYKCPCGASCAVRPGTELNQ